MTLLNQFTPAQLKIAEQRLERELNRRREKKLQAKRGWIDKNGVLQGGLMAFIRYFWHILEPSTPLVEGWPLYAICLHLEAVTFGEIDRLLITVPPGFMKSLCTDVFHPAWEWSAMDMAHMRYVAFSYSASLTERDNDRFRDLVTHDDFRYLWGDKFGVTKVGVTKIANTKRGWKLASSVGGVGTGERGDRIICFPYEQLVHTECGLISIGHIVENKLQILVPSTNVKTGIISMQPVIGWHKNPGSQVVKIKLSDGSFIRCTPAHRIWGGRRWIEAINLKPGTPLPIVLAPNAVGNIFPSTTDANGLDCGSFNAIASSQNISGFLTQRYCNNLFWSENRTAPRWQKRSVLKSIINIFLSRSINKVVETAIHCHAVFMANFLPVWARANESFQYKAMNEAIVGLSVQSQANSRVSFIRGSLQNLFWNRKKVAGSPNFSSNAFHPSHVGDKIDRPKSDNGQPSLIVESVDFDGHIDASYCLTVAENHTFHVGRRQGLIVANCDDGHNIKEAESEVVRSETVRWFRESMSDRLNDMSKGSIIVIMQRSHNLDIAGAILELELPYCHLMIQMEYDPAFPSETEIGWRDPREKDGELAWVKRFPPETVEAIKIVKGNYAYAGQYQQIPVPRGGGIIKDISWQPWQHEKFPDCEYILASLDTAYTEKEENDASALTIWGVFRKDDAPKVMLLGAWEGRLELHDLVTLVAPVCGAQVSEKELNEALELYNRGAVPATMLPRLPVDKLIIEAKASGLSVGQEMSRLYGAKGNFNVELIDPKKWGDKTARLVAIEPMFADEMVYAPVMPDGGEYRWVRRVIDNVAAAPKTTKWDTPDSVSMALRYLRVVGLLKMRTEASADMMDAMQFRPRQKALYD